MAKKHSNQAAAQPPLTEQLRLGHGPVDMGSLDPKATPGFPGKDKKDAPALQAALAPRLSDLQERLYADGRSDPEQARRVLVILQGLDTAGKGGVIRHAIGMVDPQGVQLHAFKAPTAEERKHDFLWRIRKYLPDPGMIGIYDRSQYEDVLIARVDELVPRKEWEQRYDQINEFEKQLADEGITVIKCFLNISRDKQGERLAERLADPAKYWKYNPSDLETRAKWGQYMEAYADALGRCNTEYAPWFVIPSDRKWYRNWAVTQLLTEHLEAMALEWPAADFDVAEQREKLAELG